MPIKQLGYKVLWRRTKDYIDRYDPFVVGVAGSTGKALTVKAIDLALDGMRHTRASYPNYNSRLGVAISALGLKPPSTKTGWMQLLSKSRLKEFAEEEPDTLILEVGADAPGDVDWVVNQIPINAAVITNIGSTHLRLFGNKQNVAHEHQSLTANLSENEFAILNADDPLVVEARHHTKANTILFGTANHADIRLMRSTRLSNKGFAVEIATPKTRLEFTLPNLVSFQQLHSVLAAIAVAHAMELDVKKAAQSLSGITPVPRKMEIKEGKKGATIIDDSHNASLESTLAALHLLQTLPAKRKIAILGDMLDLGGESISAHKRIGKAVIQSANVFVAVGNEMKHAGAESLRIPNKTDVHHFDDSRDVGKWLGEYIGKGDLILIKGSREMRMEHVVKRLQA